MRTEFYLTTYCNFPHRLKDGKPIQHECAILPPKALRLEKEGKYDEAIEVILAKKPFRVMRKGVRA